MNLDEIIENIELWLRLILAGLGVSLCLYVMSLTGGYAWYGLFLCGICLYHLNFPDNINFG